MSLIPTNVMDMIMDKKKYIIYILLILLFIAFAFYVYKTYISPRISKNFALNKEFIKEGNANNNSADLYFFYTDWCPHCKSAKPEWQRFKDDYENKLVKDVEINFVEIDCDKDTETATKFSVDGYPTFKLIHNNKIIEYDAKPEYETFKEFLEQSL